MMQTTTLNEALEEWFGTDLSGIPEGLRLRIIDELSPMQWDELTEGQRRELVSQCDSYNDPATESERAWYFDLYAERFEVEKEIEGLELMRADKPRERESQKRQIAKCKVQIAEIDRKLACSPAERVTDNDTGPQDQRQETNSAQLAGLASTIANREKQDPGELHVIVDAINESVSVVTDRGRGQKTEYKRRDIVGKGTTIWELLVDFAKFEGSLEGRKVADVKKRNTSANRRNLDKKLVEKMRLSRSPIVEGRRGAMCFDSIRIKGGAASTDVLDRKPESYDDLKACDYTINSQKQKRELKEQADAMLANNDED